jgi:CBS domain-containing protein
MLSVRNILSTKGGQLWFVSPSATVYQALELMAEHNIGAVPVIEGGKLVGIFSERDYARKVILKGKSSHNTLVSDLMTPKVFYVKPQRTLHDCMFLMTEKHIRHLPVIENGELAGIITIGDVVKGIIGEQKRTIEDLESYISGSMYPG